MSQVDNERLNHQIIDNQNEMIKILKQININNELQIEAYKEIIKLKEESIESKDRLIMNYELVLEELGIIPKPKAN